MKIINDINDLLIYSIDNKQPISFSKYGDGEYFCANSYVGENCDKDKYTEKLKQGIINSFIYMTSQAKNAYVGLWPRIEVQNYWESLVSTEVKWAKYHTFILDNDNKQNKVKLYKTIKYSPLKKIIICNELLEKTKILFDIDYMINVKFNNWFDSEFNLILDTLKKYINHDEQYIIITCAGMGAKVLICELCKLFPNNIYLDFGSALDKICTKKTSRGWEPTYDELINDLKDIIPENWNDPKYEYIYELAKNIVGLHVMIQDQR